MLNDNILAALLATSGSVVEVCEKLHCSRTTIYNRLRDRDFLELYWQEKAAFTRAIESSLELMLDDAMDGLGELITDKQVPPSVRLQAIRTAFDLYSRAKNMNDQLDRLVVSNQEKNCLFGFGMFSGSFTDPEEEEPEGDQAPEEPVCDPEEEEPGEEPEAAVDPEEVEKAERKKKRTKATP